MKHEHKALLAIIAQHLEDAPSVRFGQALFNLNINQFADPTNPEKEKHQLRDIHSDSDEAILQRIKIQVRK